MSKNDCTKIQKRVHAEIEELEPNILWLLSILLSRSAIYVCHCNTIESSKSNKFIVLKVLRFLSVKLWVYVQRRHFAHL